MNRVEGRRDFFKVSFATTTAVAFKAAEYLPVFASNGPEACFDQVGYYIDCYRSSTEKNIVLGPDSQRLLLPSKAYPQVYKRDQDYGADGLGDTEILENSHRLFALCQNRQTGQIPNYVEIHTGIPKGIFGRENLTFEDESTLLHIIYAGVLSEKGLPIDFESVASAKEYVENRVYEGCYVSSPGPFRYWADNIIVTEDQAIAYNQGLYVLALEYLHKMGLGRDFNTLDKARKAYAGMYDPDLGFVTHGTNSSWLDVSTLFPEALHRRLLGYGILSDEQVVNTAIKYFSSSHTVDENGSLVGFKALCQENGDPLPREVFWDKVLNKLPGDYQEGEWPLWTMVTLTLLSKTSPEYRSWAQQTAKFLMAKELEEKGQSKEFWRLCPEALGSFDDFRCDYSWGSQIIPFLNWAGIRDSPRGGIICK